MTSRLVLVPIVILGAESPATFGHLLASADSSPHTRTGPTRTYLLDPHWSEESDSPTRSLTRGILALIPLVTGQEIPWPWNNPRALGEETSPNQPSFFSCSTNNTVNASSYEIPPRPTSLGHLVHRVRQQFSLGTTTGFGLPWPRQESSISSRPVCAREANLAFRASK